MPIPAQLRCIGPPPKVDGKTLDQPYYTLPSTTVGKRRQSISVDQGYEARFLQFFSLSQEVKLAYPETMRETFSSFGVDE